MLHSAREPQGGFSFENCQRNAFLESSLKGLRVPHARKTGTTIAGLVFEGGVILGADTRATNDSVVANKNCEKIHFIAPNIYCCGAGVAADAEMTTQLMASNMELHALSTGRKPRVATVSRMLRQMLFRYQGHIGASLIIGGVDITGPHLYSVHPHGSYSHLLFTAMGSGQGPAISVLEDRFKPDMTAATPLTFFCSIHALFTSPIPFISLCSLTIPPCHLPLCLPHLSVHSVPLRFLHLCPFTLPYLLSPHHLHLLTFFLLVSMSPQSLHFPLFLHSLSR
ncbi:proteasome subunit beta type-10 isoform X1 [Phascolarctos cinereus]